MKINLSGELITTEWAELFRYYGITEGFYCPGDIREAIANLDPGEELTLEINSVGGSVDSAAEIYSLLEGCDHRTVAEIQSLAASAASYFPLACDTVRISLPAQMMIHFSSFALGGNKNDHAWAATVLDATDNSILDVYCRKCGDKATRDQLEQLMAAETYLTARQALDLGLVDEIIGDAAEEVDQPIMLVASITNSVVRALSTLPDIRELKARRDAELAETVTLDRAMLDLEKSRF